MTRGGRVEWPPGEGAPPGITPGATTTNDVAALATRTGRHAESYGAGPVGRYVEGFQDGFDRGAQDALRLMGRRCHCLDCAAEAEKLAEYYRGAADRRAS